jgi:gelsolin
VQYLKDTNHDGKCDVAAVGKLHFGKKWFGEDPIFGQNYNLVFQTEDGKLMADADAGEFWGLFGGFAPLPRKTFSEFNGKDSAFTSKLLW